MFHQGDTKATISIADELGKLAKLKEQGVITEEEFSQMKRNLMEGMKDHWINITPKQNV